MARSAQIVGQATDAHGRQWDVRERRPTAHGWLLHVGWPAGEPRGQGCGGVRVILTVELADYLGRTRLRDVDLPMGGTTVKRLRRELGLHWSWDAWWSERADDLRALTLQAFADRHGCSTGAASQRRHHMNQVTP